MQEIRLDGFTEALQSAKSVVITNHTNPDGDAMGSALALQKILVGLGKEAHVIVPNPYPEFLHWLAGNDTVMVYSNGKKAANALIEKADMIFHLDYNAYGRSGDMEETLRAASAQKVMIDHHRQPESWPDFMYSDTDMCSTSQMIYELADMYNWTGHLDKGAAECLYTGIVTDTGSFKFASTTARTHEVAAALIGLGVSSQEVQGKLFDSQPAARLKLLGIMLEQMEIDNDGERVLLYLSQDQCVNNGYIKGITEGFVNYGLSIGTAQMSVFLREENGVVKCSLRSKGDLDVNVIARAHFNGGGHKNAAGGRLEGNLQEAIAHVKSSLKW